LHHPITKRIVDLTDGEYREGVIVKTGKPILVDIGVEHPIPLNERTTSLEKRITVKIHKNKDQIHIQKVEIPTAMYWGYRVNATKDPLSQILWKGGFDLVVLTSKYGESFTEVINDFRKRLNDSSRVLVAFGSAKQGIKEIIENDGVTMESISAMIVNTIPKQGTETIRTEEAICATLAILNIMNK
jgi:hypothetical protein